MEQIFIDKIQTSNRPVDYLINFVNPLTPYFICNHFISTEIIPKNRKYVGINIYLLLYGKNDLLRTKNYNSIKNYDIIQIQVDWFDFFYDKVLPFLNKNNINVIIITSQIHLPQIKQNKKTDEILRNKNILLWISQNPIYTNNDKYIAFPYGLDYHKLSYYIQFIKYFNKVISNPSNKEIKILNQYSTPHGHLPENHIRKKYDIFGKKSGPKLNYNQYLQNISNSEFVISTSGDRDDCYRHYECIGLNAIPISNIGNGYINIFEENMIYSNAEEMINIIKNKNVNYTYKSPNRDILTTFYWINKINEKINKIKQKNEEIVE